jgi:hypothetical protein
MKSLLITAAAAFMLASFAAPALAKGSPAPFYGPLRPGECNWNRLPVRRMDGTWTNPNRCCGDLHCNDPHPAIHHHDRHR